MDQYNVLTYVFNKSSRNDNEISNNVTYTYNWRNQYSLPRFFLQLFHISMKNFFFFKKKNPNNHQDTQ